MRKNLTDRLSAGWRKKATSEYAGGKSLDGCKTTDAYSLVPLLTKPGDCIIFILMRRNRKATRKSLVAFEPKVRLHKTVSAG
jgi:hypothetical protein